MMDFCSNCGGKIKSGVGFCPNCGLRKGEIKTILPSKKQEIPIKGNSKSTIGLVFCWVFGVFFLFQGMGAIVEGYFVGGIVIIFCSVLIIPYFSKLVKEKYGFPITGGIKLSLFVAIIVVIVLIVLTVSQQNLASSQEKVASSVASSQEQVKTDYVLGDVILAGDFNWKITKVSTRKAIGDIVMGTLLGEISDGIFVILDVEVENTAKSAQYLTDSSVMLVDAQKREFSPDSVAAFYLKPEGSALMFEQLNPGIIKRGKIVYDVPEDLRTFYLKISPGFFSSDVYSGKITI